jgi:hypothetical protein
MNPLQVASIDSGSASLGRKEAGAEQGSDDGTFVPSGSNPLLYLRITDGSRSLGQATPTGPDQAVRLSMAMTSDSTTERLR